MHSFKAQNKKTGDKIHTGDTLATLYANDEGMLISAERAFLGVYKFSESEVSVGKLIYKTVLK